MSNKLFCILFAVMNVGCQFKHDKLHLFLAQKNSVVERYIDYKEIHEQINRKVEFKIDLRQEDARGIFGHQFQIDSFIVFNTKENKLFTTINVSYKKTNGRADLVRALYGVKIGDSWNVYFGASCIAFREGYKYERYEPFTWEELSYVAHDNFFRRYIDVDRKGNLIINHELLESDITPRKLGGTNYITEKTEEENFIKLTQYFESRKIDDVEYQRLLDEVNNPEPQKRWPIQKVTWWQRLMGEEVPIFETKEWKEYLEKKYGKVSEQ